jgi:Flp pilus assembly protein TadG
MKIRRARTIRGRSGQALIEMALVVVLFVTLTMGVLEFGRAWMIGNMITHAARDGARAAAVTPFGSRTTGGTITNTAAIQANVLASISNVVPTTGFNVAVAQPTIGGIPMVQVTVTATVPYLFNLVGPNFTVNRVVTFRDEGR